SAWTRTTEGRTFSTMAEISFSSFWRVVSSFCGAAGGAWTKATESRKNRGVQATTLLLEILLATRRDRLHPGEVEVPVRVHPRHGRGRSRPENESTGGVRESRGLDGAGDVDGGLGGHGSRHGAGIAAGRDVDQDADRDP